ncbi:cation-translocating P-type ATPase [Nocardia yamanashiensis]|uniref:cation-translocating P-type ATPase n=1 Tax=Nocardia yamanashiensis TaxID=209247 RepID=UPI001E2AA6FB|nr:cation-translocating P-type ATPase [Nocardia yamanashiensis]UGT42740.1 cation-translocating P-type ATPase [Nocardia yamanashiensis]
MSERGRVLALSAATLTGLLLASGPAGGRPVAATAPLSSATGLSLVSGMLAGRSAARASGVTAVPLVPWHALEADEVLARLPAPPEASAAHGAVASGAIRTARWFATPATTLGELATQVRRELADPLTPLLAVGAVASALLGSPTDAVLVGSVLGLNAVVSALQRRRAGQSLHRLLVGERLLARRVENPRERRVVGSDGEAHESRHISSHDSSEYDAHESGRSSDQGNLGGGSGAVGSIGEREGEVAADGLRVGDVIVLRAGDVVPADARLLAAEGLEVDESGLTGESVTVEKEVGATPGAALGDRSCMVFEGGVVVNGQARAVVVAVGAGTEAGRALAAAGAPRGGGVQAQLKSLSAQVLPLTLGGGSVVAAASFLRGLPLRPALADGLAVAVAAVPEGLPLVATVAQLAATRRLSRHGVLVRSSRTIEALGRLDTVCFDKTGTLTAGRLHLDALADADETWDTENASGSPQSRRLLRAAARACPHEDDGPTHATDRAVVEAADRLLGAKAAHTWDPIEEVPFESNRGYAAAVGHTAHHIRLAVKGAPEVLLPRCTQVLRANGDGDRTITAFDAEQRADAEAAVQRLAERGLRVLVVARRDFPRAPAEVADEIEQLTLLGFIGLADTPRPQTPDLVGQLARNDISVRMITGDHPVTARAVARQLGIPADEVATGADIDALDEDEQTELIDRATVFARVTPEHKVRIVTALQRRGHVVAMTGDGSNDAAAIRSADIGIGLAARGSVAAREAADLIITGAPVSDADRGGESADPADDLDLTVLLTALVEGRGMWQRVRDAIGVLVGGNAGEVTFTVLGTLLSGRAPIGTRQFLLVNLLTDLGPAMAVALSSTRTSTDAAEPADTGSELGELPRPELGGDFLRTVAVRGACTTAGAGAAWLLGRATGTQRRAATMALAALVSTQLGQTLVIGRHSPLVWVTAAGSTALLAGIIMTPGVNRFFGCVALDPVAWAIVTGCAVGGTIGAVYAGHALAA